MSLINPYGFLFGLVQSPVLYWEVWFFPALNILSPSKWRLGSVSSTHDELPGPRMRGSLRKNRWRSVLKVEFALCSVREQLTEEWMEYHHCPGSTVLCALPWSWSWTLNPVCKYSISKKIPKSWNLTLKIQYYRCYYLAMPFNSWYKS